IVPRMRVLKEYSVLFFIDVFDGAENADQPVDLFVVRLEVVVADRPVVAEAIEALAFEIVGSEAQRDAAPVVRAAAEHARAEPLKVLAGRGGVGLPLERPPAERCGEPAERPLRD